VKYRIVYTVVQPLRARTEKSAAEAFQSMSDDLAEFCDAALSSSSVKATLQVWDPRPLPLHKEYGVWMDVE